MNAKAMLFTLLIFGFYNLTLSEQILPPRILKNIIHKNKVKTSQLTQKGLSLNAPVKVTTGLQRQGEVTFFEDFEAGAGGWSLHGDAWEIGKPNTGPDFAYSGTNVAATNLSGAYPANADAHLISPTIILPTLTQEKDQLRLHFWQWFQTESNYDHCYVFVTDDDGQSWTDLGYYDGSQEAWTMADLDLSSYAGRSIRISFSFFSDGSLNYAGWYLDDISVEYVQYFGAEDIEIAVAANGQFTMGIPNGPILLYGHPEPGTSATTVRIDGVDYWNYNQTTWGDVIVPPSTEGFSNTTIWNINGVVQLTQTLSIVKGSSSGRYDTGEIKYIVLNTDNMPHSIGIRIMLDTMLGTNDGAPFRIPGTGAVTTEMEWDEEHISPYYQAFDNLNNPTVQSQGTLIGGNALRPDRFVTAGWNHINDSPWDFTTNWGDDYWWGDYGYDSAAGIYWEPVTLQAGESKSFVTYYGLGGMDIDLQPPLVSALTAPNSMVFLNEVSGGNPFTLTIYLSNTSPGVTEAAQGVSTVLNLPDGLELASGETARHDIPNLEIGAEYQTSYKIKVQSSAAEAQTYSVKIRADNTTSKTMEKDVYIFGIQTTPVAGGQIGAEETISATFNVDMDASTINKETFIISDETACISGTVSYDAVSRTAIFAPNNSLESGKQYRATLSSKINSVDGIELPYDVNWSFTVSLYQPKFTFVHMTDVHIGYESSEASDYTNFIPFLLRTVKASDLFTDAFEDMERKGVEPDFIIITGDLVESTKDNNLNKFMGLIKEQKVPIYIVPGNHDRYKKSILEMIKSWLGQTIIGDMRKKVDDFLENFYNAIGDPRKMEGVNILEKFEDFDSYSENTIEGVDWYNYTFNKDGYLFIGIDSGSDSKIARKPKSEGLNYRHLSALQSISENSDMPKIIFMHHPIQPKENGEGAEEKETIQQNRDEFFKYCADKYPGQNNRVTLVLGGHTHESHVYDISGLDLTKFSYENFFAEPGSPLFIQTPSAVKDKGEYAHGYRVVDVYDNAVKVHRYKPTSTDIPKTVFAALGPVFPNVYDSEGRYTGHGSIIVEIPHSYYTGFYDDSTAQTIILYDTTLAYQYQVRGAKDGHYSMAIASIHGPDTTNFWARDIPISSKGVYQYSVNWDALARGEKGVSIDIDFDGDGTFERTILTGDSLTGTEITPPTSGQLDNDNIYIYPNPFNPDTESGTIRYSLAKDAAVTIKIYDAAMQLVATLLTDEPQQADVEQAVSWNGTNDMGEIVANGVYFYVIESSAGERAVGKAAVLR